VRRLSNEDRAGIYLTVIVHLTVIIILLITQIGFSLSKENTFVLDFSQKEAQEDQKKVDDLKQEVSKKVAEIMAASSYGTPVRNVSVNRSSLKDDRNTNADELYKDAERLEKELKESNPQQPEEDMRNEVVDVGHDKKVEAKPAKEYSGPSVLSWSLDGRHASRLPIPAYRCYGAGQVTVIIGVDPGGNVVYAKVQEEGSSDDGCLRGFAIRAARASKFSINSSAPSRQMGNIVYQFIAQ
jgi:hypothetical protein